MGLLASACTSSTTPTTTSIAATPGTDGAGVATTAAPATTATPPGTTDAGGATRTTTPPVITASAGLDQAVVDRLSEQIIDLIGVTEQVRGLPFLTQPNVAILTPEELAARVRADVEEDIDSDELAVDTAVLQLLGLLEPGADLETMLLDLYSEQGAGFYDGDTGELVIRGEAADLTPLPKSVVVHELIHALTDQHFLFNDDFQAMFDEERYDEGAAFQALIEGDATYFQFVYIQQLTAAEQLALATEAVTQIEGTSVLQSVPGWIQDDLAFPYNNGQLFVQSLVDAGGIAAVDTAYVERPASTEAVMHPARFASGELIRQVEPISITLEGYEVHETSTYGEWGFRLLLSDSAAPGTAAQAANGWGGDSYQVLFAGDDVVLAITYKGDTEQDAFELADALVIHASETMGMGEGVGDGGGLGFTTDDGRYVYVDRIGDGFVFVAATNAAAGLAARDQLRVP